MNKRILYVRTAPFDFDPNTYNVQEVGLGKAFCELGYDYDYLCFTAKKESMYVLAEINGKKLTVMKKKRLRWFRTGINLKICDKEFLKPYDFIISSEYGQFMTYALSKVSNKVILYSGPYYNLFKIPFVSPIYDFLFNRTINKNIQYKFVKSQLAKEYLERKGYNNVISIGVGLDIERFDSVTEIEPETQKLIDFMENNRCILYVGALSDRKNYPFLLEIYKKVHAEVPDVKFVMIGKGNLKYVSKYLNQLSDEVQAGIYRMEKINNAQLKYIYPLAKAFLLPSKLEIFGMVLLEAMYLGAPVITSWNGGSSTLIKGRETGQIVEEFNADKWKSAVRKYLDNESYVSKITKNAKELIQKEYVWEALAKKILDVVKKNEDM